MLTGAHDKICTIRKEHLQHWIFKNVDQRSFKVQIRRTWDAHPFNITNQVISTVQQNYQTLVDHQKGPCVIEHFNTVATQFQVCQTTPVSLTILLNFINEQMLRMYSKGSLGSKLSNINFGINHPILIKKPEQAFTGRMSINTQMKFQKMR